MVLPRQFPRVRSEFANEAGWGTLSADLRRYELATPTLPGPILGVSRAIGCIHVGRASLIVRVDGGHLRAPVKELLKMLTAKAPVHLDSAVSGPAEYIGNIVSWLEEEQRSGFLERTYTTATILVAVSDHEAWTWLVSPHGVVRGRPDATVGAERN